MTSISSAASAIRAATHIRERLLLTAALGRSIHELVPDDDCAV